MDLIRMSEHVCNGFMLKAEILPGMPYILRDVAYRNGCNANDAFVLEPGKEIFLHGHNPNENEIYIVFKGDGTTEVQMCHRGEKHCLKNDSEVDWFIIAIKIDGEVSFSL